MHAMKINEKCHEFEVEWGRVYIEVGKKGRHAKGEEPGAIAKMLRTSKLTFFTSCNDYFLICTGSEQMRSTSVADLTEVEHICETLSKIEPIEN